MKQTGAVLVAAGMSTRMKEFKPMLPFGDSTIALHIVSMLQKLDISPIVVVTGHRAEDLESHLFHTGVRFLRNERYRKTQMFDSVKMGIQAILQECERVMVMPIDAPGIRPETFKQVLMIDAAMIRTVYQGEPGHPILLRSDIARQLCGYTGERGLRGAMENAGISIVDIEVEDRGVCWDVDTQEEYQGLLEWNYQLGDGYPIRPLVQVRLKGSEVFFGPGTASLLDHIQRTGSLQEACHQMGLSYSKGSRMVKAVERQMGFSVVERWAGGPGGGGSLLTEGGKQLLKSYQAMVKDIQKSTERIYGRYFGKGFRS